MAKVIRLPRLFIDEVVTIDLQGEQVKVKIIKFYGKNLYRVKILEGYHKGLYTDLNIMNKAKK